MIRPLAKLGMSMHSRYGQFGDHMKKSSIFHDQFNSPESASFSSLEICALGHMNVSRFLCGNKKVFITPHA
jgi:hypothetical protein